MCLIQQMQSVDHFHERRGGEEETNKGQLGPACSLLETSSEDGNESEGDQGGGWEGGRGTGKEEGEAG